MLTKLWMKQNVVQIDADTTLGEAREIIDSHNFRHLPVTSDNKLIGIVSMTDINKAMPSPVDSAIKPEDHIIVLQSKISTFMTSTPITVSPLDPIEDVAALFRKFKIGAIPVVEDGNILIGIISEADVFDALRAIMAGEKDDTRIELLAANNQSSFYKIMAVCQKHEANINSIAIYRNYSKEQQLITLRVNGCDSDTLTSALWDAGMKIIQVDHDREE